MTIEIQEQELGWDIKMALQHGDIVAALRMVAQNDYLDGAIYLIKACDDANLNVVLSIATLYGANKIVKYLLTLDDVVDVNTTYSFQPVYRNNISENLATTPIPIYFDPLSNNENQEILHVGVTDNVNYTLA
jgi:hypothetical protein